MPYTPDPFTHSTRSGHTPCSGGPVCQSTGNSAAAVIPEGPAVKEFWFSAIGLPPDVAMVLVSPAMIIFLLVRGNASEKGL